MGRAGWDACRARSLQAPGPRLLAWSGGRSPGAHGRARAIAAWCRSGWRRAPRLADTAARASSFPPWEAADLALLRRLLPAGSRPLVLLGAALPQAEAGGAASAQDFLIFLYCQDPATGERVDVRAVVGGLCHRGVDPAAPGASASEGPASSSP